jgi:hypothetical protein
MTSKLLTGNATDLWPAFLAAANRTSDSYLAKENGTGTRAEFEAAFAEQDKADGGNHRAAARPGCHDHSTADAIVVQGHLGH